MTHQTRSLLAVLLFVSGGARADALVRRGGEWQSTVTGMGPTPQTMELCLPPATMEQAMAKLAADKKCSRKDMKMTGNILSISIDCGMMTMQGTATIESDSAYTADLTINMTGGSHPMSFHTITTSRWIGACKAEERPLN